VRVVQYSSAAGIGARPRWHTRSTARVLAHCGSRPAAVV
jgi:hypothetical protein